jgi:hypothetical protein
MEAQLYCGGDLIHVLAAGAGRANKTQLHFILGNAGNSAVRIHRCVSTISFEMAFQASKSSFICRAATAGNARPARTSGVSKNSGQRLQLNSRRNTFAAGSPTVRNSKQTVNKRMRNGGDLISLRFAQFQKLKPR